MVKRRWTGFQAKEAAMELLNQMMRDKPLLPFLIPLGLFAWAVERWLVPFSNWVPLAAAVWATIQLVRHEHLFYSYFCLLWCSMKRLKYRKPKWIEKIELQEFSLGPCPPNLGRNGMQWITSGDQV
ncbi:hypothetical protein GW17_00030250 [Ensete ventricosum]|nr:hypothetical protein GW17_00030250 [Ensete ventricosum]